MDMELNSNRGFIPNLCEVSAVFMLILMVELLSLLLALASSEQTGFWQRLAFISFFAQWLGLINASLLCLLKNWLNKQTVLLCASFSFVMMLFVTFIFSALVIYIGDMLAISGSPSKQQIIYFIVRNMAISSIIYGVLLRYFYVQYQWRSNLQAQSHAQVQALKARIRPHFLFNCMNTIASLVHIDADKAEKAVEDLSDLFRASLQEDTVHTLRDELDLVASYLDIEHLRLDQRLSTDWQLDDDAMTIEVPSLCLQPLVENAIYHGIEPLPDGGNIKISAQLENNRLCLSVSNPVIGHGAMSRHKGNHMAQANIQTRLALMYGDEAEFNINAEPDLYTVSIGIPLKI
ncbi:MAG: sensor histidine kinase [endosymbiont of Galathealinum brachiosum]|uniref:Sensor histidine kinase n=1 Tax=endosymbiont of Galathealinum brachiosum TaxID=2200906 RepID=A0A370DCY9_9GAMM|nr:MAG: sensor histidine kinase [endosymbiont of Galathealinum brachiosum]